MNDDFSTRRQAKLAAERQALAQARQTDQPLILPPSEDDPPEVVAVVESRLPGMPGTPDWVHDKRREAWAILLDGVLAMSGAGLRLEGRPADAVLAREPASSAPLSAAEVRVKTKPAKTRHRPQKAAQRASRPGKVPKVRPAPKPRPERPAPPDELRCAATNSRGSRCKLEAVADGRCLLHGSNG